MQSASECQDPVTTRQDRSQTSRTSSPALQPSRMSARTVFTDYSHEGSLQGGGKCADLVSSLVLSTAAKGAALAEGAAVWRVTPTHADDWVGHRAPHVPMLLW